MKSKADAMTRTLQAGVLAWLVPGAGHWLLGQRGIAWVFFLAISLPYFAGVLIGGVKDSINPVTNRWLFLAEVCIGGYTSVGYLASRSIQVPPGREPEFIAYYPESDIAQIYLATASLLNVLAIIDALARAQTGQPTFHREAQAAAPPAQPESQA